MYIYIYIYIYIRGGTVHVFVPNRHGTDLSVRCMRPYNEYRQFTPNPEGGARSNATLFDNRQQKNSECRELQCCQFSDFVARFSDFSDPPSDFFPKKRLATNLATSWTNLSESL